MSGFTEDYFTSSPRNWFDARPLRLCCIESSKLMLFHGCVLFHVHLRFWICEFLFVGLWVPGSEGTSDKTLQKASERECVHGEAGLRTFGFVRLTGCSARALFSFIFVTVLDIC